MPVRAKQNFGALVLFAAVIALLVPPAVFGWVEGQNIKINTDNTTELQNEQACVINPLNADNVVAIWRDFRLGFRRVGVGVSNDGGATWSDSLVGVPPYDRHSDPVMSYDADGNLLMNILAFPSTAGNSGLFVWTSTDGGASWSEPVTAVDEGPGGPFEDKQWMNVDRTGGTYNNRVYVPWARFTSSSRIYLVHSITPTIYSSPVPVSDAFSVQWPTVTVTPDGTVLVAWVSFGLSRIMLDRSTDGGDTWGSDKTVVSLSGIPQNINGGILIFPYPAMEADVTGGPYNGTTYILYSGFAADGSTDLSLLRSTNKGDTWSAPVRIHDDPLNNGADQFHPWIAINEDGILTASWYDRRLDPNNLNFDLYIAHSFDGGATWTANRRISEVSSSPAQAFKVDREFYARWHAAIGLLEAPLDPAKAPRAGLIGEYTGLSTRSDMAQVVFTDTRNGNQDAYSARATIGFMPPPLIAPANGTVTSGNMPTFSWKKAGATPAEIANFPATTVQPLYYRVQVADDSLFGSVDYQAVGITGTSHQFAAPLADGRWFWRVDAVNDSGRVTGYAEPYRVVTIDTQAPAQPTLLTPAEDESVDYLSQLFSWTAVDKAPQGTAVRYELQVATDIGFGTVLINPTGLTAPQFENSTPLPDGAALYCRVRARDLAFNIGEYTAPRRFFTGSAFVCGDADGTGAVNISDAVYLINYIFAGGPAPDPLLAADVDCTGAVTISDAVYLIAFIFSGGPAPCAGC